MNQRPTMFCPCRWSWQSIQTTLLGMTGSQIGVWGLSRDQESAKGRLHPASRCSSLMGWFRRVLAGTDRPPSTESWSGLRGQSGEQPQNRQVATRLPVHLCEDVRSFLSEDRRLSPALISNPYRPALGLQRGRSLMCPLSMQHLTCQSNNNMDSADVMSLSCPQHRELTKYTSSSKSDQTWLFMKNKTAD